MGAGDGVRDVNGAHVAVRFAITPRPRSLLYAMIGVIIVESAAVHALIYKRWPMASVALLVLNVWTLWWLWREFSAESWVRVSPDSIEVRAGRSVRIVAPRASVRSVRRPEWRDLPQPGTKGYLRIAGGEDPNVLVEFQAGVVAELPMGMKRSVTTLGVHLIDPKAFASRNESPSAADSGDAGSQAAVQR